MRLLIVFVVTWYIVRHSFDYCLYCLGRRPTGGNRFVPRHFAGHLRLQKAPKRLVFTKNSSRNVRSQTEKLLVFVYSKLLISRNFNKKTKINWHSLLDLLYDCTFYNDDMKESELTNERL